jgi:hypothetical protein
MASLDQIKRQAQATANREQRPMAVINLNRVGLPLYVIRDVPSEAAIEREGKGWMVETFQPEP